MYVVNLSAVAGASNMHPMQKISGKILFFYFTQKNIFRKTDFEAEF